jgi:hypothetical protein
MIQAARSGVRVPMRCIILHLSNHSSGTTALRSTLPLTEMSTRNFLGGIKGGRRVSLTNLHPSVSRLYVETVGAPTSHNPMGLHGLLQG